MLDTEKKFEKFSKALPEDLGLDDEKKRQAFDFLFKISYQYLMENN